MMPSVMVGWEEGTMSEEILKSTRGREAVKQAFEHAIHPLTADEVFAVVNANGADTSLATVYRTLATLATRGYLLKDIGVDGKARYQQSEHGHVHYLRCSVCGEVRPLSFCPLEGIEERLARESGYAITGHRLEVIGVCPSCIAQREEQYAKR